MKTVWFIKDMEDGRFMIAFCQNRVWFGPEHLAVHFLSPQAYQMIINRYRKAGKILAGSIRQVRAPLGELAPQFTRSGH